MSAHDSLCHSISPTRSIYLDSGKAVNSRDCFSKLGSHRKPSHYCQTFVVTLFHQRVRRMIFSQRHYALQFNVLALADRF
jgi:hypothetical protein